jgi:hypothetical protein
LETEHRKGNFFSDSIGVPAHQIAMCAYCGIGDDQQPKGYPMLGKRAFTGGNWRWIRFASSRSDESDIVWNPHVNPACLINTTRARSTRRQNLCALRALCAKRIIIFFGGDWNVHCRSLFRG